MEAKVTDTRELLDGMKPADPPLCGVQLMPEDGDYVALRQKIGQAMREGRVIFVRGRTPKEPA